MPVEAAEVRRRNSRLLFVSGEGKVEVSLGGRGSEKVSVKTREGGGISM
jgi:hypothetical protein